MKNILFISLLLSLPIFLSAQLNIAWTSNIPANKLPTTAYIPTVTKLTSPQRISFTVDVPGTLDNANDSTAVAAVGDAVETKLKTYYVVPIWGIDTSSLEITSRVLITEIRRRFDTFEYADFRNQYKVATNVFRVKGVFEWVVED